MDFNVELKNRVKLIEEKIYQFLPESEGKQKLIFDAMSYSYKAGGKRLRPMFMLETAKLFGDVSDDIYSFMAAIEMIHTYSLVHDDLPAMDNDELRRGMPTTHIKFGEDIAILAGDGLLNLAYETMANTVINSEEPYNAAYAMKYMADKAGVFGMVGGQTVDVINEGKKVGNDTLEFIYELKTAALIQAAMVAGAILAKADDEAISKIENAAYKIGMAFQIQDDILDIVGDEKEIGKPIGSDEKNDKYTFVTVNGLEKSKEYVNKYSKEAMDILNSFDNKNEFLNTLVEKLINRTK